MQTKEQLLDQLKNASKVFENQLIEEAFTKIDRADFVPEDYNIEAYEDYPLPIGYDQTISQPTTTAFMLELLDPKPGEKILDVGSGSGFTTALLAQIVGKKGEVWGVEIIPELVEISKQSIVKYNLPQAHIELTKKMGRAEKAPFDKILVSASAKELPGELINQLKVGGIMVIPVEETIYKIKKTEKGFEEEKDFPGFLFVPLR
ncbi:MAG: protein-L-isoaspartate O-methyltransferase [Candidatus Paceibacterota bacterium]